VTGSQQEVICELTPRLISMADQITIAALLVYDWRFLMVKIRMI
jgi:hypothetical protein